jgi:putative protease
MKVAAIIQSIKQAYEIKDMVSSYIVPITNFSINYTKTFTLEEVMSLKGTGKEIFLVINKNIHNNELESLEKLLIEINNLDISGIIFYDIALVNMKKRLNLKIPLVWSQEHLVTNYETINYWYSKGAEYAYLSSELTKPEMDEIMKNSRAKLFVNVFGYVPMFTSRRHLVNNYLEYFNLDDEKKVKTIYKEDKYYPIEDNYHGTTVYSNYVLNALDEDFSLADYIVFNSNLISEEDFYDTLIKYKKGEKDYKFPFEHGFLYQETIYRVKRDE